MGRERGVGAVFTDWRSVVDHPGVGAIAIATPPSVQPLIAGAAIEAGRHVFCEKPLALRLEESEKLSSAARNAGVANVIDFEFPEIPLWQQARDLLHGGLIGRLRQITVVWQVETYANRFRIRSWKTNAAEGGGTLQNFVSHVFHYIEWFAGPIRDLTVRLIGPEGAHLSDSMVTAGLLLADGCGCSVTVSTQACNGGGHTVEFYGEEGMLRLANPGADYVDGFSLCVHGRDVEPEHFGPHPSGLDDGRIFAAGKIVERFGRWILEGVPCKPDFSEGVRVQRLLGAAKRSNEEGRRISIA